MTSNRLNTRYNSNRIKGNRTKLTCSWKMSNLFLFGLNPGSVAPMFTIA